MKCSHCASEMTSATAPVSWIRHGYRVLLDTVPAWFCEQCGEA